MKNISYELKKYLQGPILLIRFSFRDPTVKKSQTHFGALVALENLTNESKFL